MEKHCPACGMAQSGDRARCYNCNASLEREQLVAPKPVESSGPRQRKTQLFYTEGLDPAKAGPPGEGAPPEASGPRTKVTVSEIASDEPPPSSGPQARTTGGLTPADGSPLLKRDTGRRDAQGLTPNEGTRLVRGAGAAAADPTQFRPPVAPPRTRGSSGDPSEIAPPTGKFKKQADGTTVRDATPSARPRPVPVGTSAPAGADPRKTSSEVRIPAAPGGAEPATEPPVFGASLKKTGEVAVPGAPTLEPKRTLQQTGESGGRARPAIPDAVAAAVQAANAVAEGGAAPAAPATAPAPYESGPAPASRLAPRKTGPLSGPAGMPHYLTTQVLGEPVALARTQATRIGRAEDNEIIFPLGQVSRLHAEVRWDEAAAAYLVVDMNSANGTFVNGKSVKRRRLTDGDRIGIGPFTLHYRTQTGSPPAVPDETEAIRTGSLAGDAAEIPIGDVARFVETLRKTGELAVLSSTGERGCLVFRDGQPVHAEWKMSLGTQAAVAIFRVKAGSFRFAAKPIEVQKSSITAPLATLLEEASK
ncbi:FHA domain-containing protein [bacterium]|nr:FHA domain-containing protein [bacterium]